MEKTGITAVILVGDHEEKNLPRCLKSILWVEEILAILDNHPSDETIKILEKAGVKIYYRDLDNFCAQRNFALEKVRTPWVLSIDVDEEVPLEMAQEIQKAIKDSRYVGYRFPRKNMIFGTWIEHAGWYPDYQLHLYQKEARYVRKVHEQVEIKGEIGDLKNALIHYNYQSVDQYLRKIDKYSSLEAENQIDAGHKFVWFDLIRKPLNEFLRRFFAEEGYKDGVHGLALSLLQAFSEIAVYLKIWERQGFKKEDLPEVFEEIKTGVSQVSYWVNQKEKNPLKKILRKLLS